MEKIVIKKMNNVNRDESTMVRIDKKVHEQIKKISEETDYSVQYLTNFLLKEAIAAVEVVD